MPRLHRKLINGRFYVLASVQGRVVTYQLKPDLHQRFCREGRKDGDYIDQAEVIRLAQTGELYTKGLAPLVAAPHPELVFPQEDPPADSTVNQTNESPERPHLDEDSDSPEQELEPDHRMLAIALVALVLLAVLVLWMISGV